MSKPNKGRVIFHVDMNSFYASVETAFDPALKGKPVAIAGDPEQRRGIIVTCSYEARARGVKTTMPLWQAKKLCPELIVRRPNFKRYRKASKAMFQLLKSYTELVEPVSIDEGYMDVTDVQLHPVTLAKEIQQRLVDELLLPCSIGIAPNKFLAKMASDMKKPLGITILRKRDLKNVLWPLPVEEMHGVGKKSTEKLKRIGIQTIGDLASGQHVQLEKVLGVNGRRLKDRANGFDDRAVDPHSIFDFKSVGNSTTLPNDSEDEEEIYRIIAKLSQSVSSRLKRKGVMAGKVSIMIRFHDRKTITRSVKVENPTDLKEEIEKKAVHLFQRHWNGVPIRLVGVSAVDLVEKEAAFKQLDLFSFEQDAMKEPLQKTVLQIQEKYGEHILRKGAKLDDGKQMEGTSFTKDFLQDE
ncbi:DNA polymerase IV [Bacillus sp. FJAT-47783]|uniref:DNA polymerase IV n=1 Tax=Bacillus sp. FJAT-47783 TaxID=2922712 RepID=UPI001FAD13AC|nr:DNA polymerase IV [Bacillus sp. FJAT-47783]